MKNKKNMRISENTDNFFFDIQSNVGIRQKERNSKRNKISKTDSMDIIVEYFKKDNNTYLKLINLIMEKYNGTN